MSDTPETPDPQEPDTTPEPAPETSEAPAEEKAPELSYEDALAALTKTRREAASLRVRLRDTESRLEGLKSPEEVEAALAEISAANAAAQRALLVEAVSLKHDLPAPLAERLRGDTREELEADAQALLASLGHPSTTPTGTGGGLHPGTNESEEISPEEIVRRYGRRAR